MAANLLLQRILNDTIQNSFGSAGSSLEETFLRNFHRRTSSGHSANIASSHQPHHAHHHSPHSHHHHHHHHQQPHHKQQPLDQNHQLHPAGTARDIVPSEAPTSQRDERLADAEFILPVEGLVASLNETSSQLAPHLSLSAANSSAASTMMLLPDQIAGSAGASWAAAGNASSVTDRLAAAAAADRLEGLAQSQLDSSMEMSQYERIFWVLIFTLMVLIAAGGNTIVIYIVSTNKDMKSVTNYFLVNLSLADTMVSTLNVIFNFISMLLSHWPFGKVYCKISNFIAILSISASVFTLTAISCDRYNAILHPLKPRMSHAHAIGWILLIWTLSAALAAPEAIYSTLVGDEDRLMNGNAGVICTMQWSDGRYPTSQYDHIYNIILMIVTYLVPILTMAILYYKMGKELWGYEAIGENVDKQQRAIMAKKKIVKMMIVVVIIFALCWLPYHAFFVVNFYLPNLFQDVPLQYQRCYLIMYWLAMSNSMYNPIIIYFMNSKKILCFLPCCRTYTVISSNSSNK